jgi:acetyltransferase-like isoleucine patch superfamily enzyme
MIHPLSDVQSKQIGSSTSIWQFVVVLKKAKLGENCNICSHCFIENDVVIGNNVTVKNGVQLWDGITIEDNVFIGPNVTFTNDRYPRSRASEFNCEKTFVRVGAVIGANSTILPGITIGEHSLIAAGSVVTKDVAPYSMVLGNPAKHVKFLENK